MPRLSVNVNDETAAAIKELQSMEGSATEVVRRAVGLYDFLRVAQDRGDKILLVDGPRQTSVEVF